MSLSYNIHYSKAIHQSRGKIIPYRTKKFIEIKARKICDCQNRQNYYPLKVKSKKAYVTGNSPKHSHVCFYRCPHWCSIQATSDIHSNTL